MPFPDRFLWGAATSAFQIEGSPLADGAGPSIWQRFARTPGMTVGGETGDVACDHYRRMPEDVALMRDLGLQAYRFSVNWGRVLPEGTGRVNEPGLDFYDRLVDRLTEAGIEPLLTLYHWDLPAALDARGGWLNRDVADWLADYLLNEAGVVTLPGNAFGPNGEGYLRLIFANSLENIQEALERVAAALAILAKVQQDKGTSPDLTGFRGHFSTYIHR